MLAFSDRCGDAILLVEVLSNELGRFDQRKQRIDADAHDNKIR
jgi:hypothetical protein